MPTPGHATSFRDTMVAVSLNDVRLLAAFLSSPSEAWSLIDG
jgi:hypothetical protein